MNPEKQRLLNETYDKYMELMLGDLPLDSVNELAVDDVTGYGSTVDEKINDINRLRQLVIDQRNRARELIYLLIRIMFTQDKSGRGYSNFY